MLLMTLKGIKRMLDRALAPIKPGATIPVDDPQRLDTTSFSSVIANVENARDMIEELIGELEREPEVIPKRLPLGTGAKDLDPEANAAKKEILG